MCFKTIKLFINEVKSICRWRTWATRGQCFFTIISSSSSPDGGNKATFTWFKPGRQQCKALKKMQYTWFARHLVKHYCSNSLHRARTGRSEPRPRFFHRWKVNETRGSAGVELYSCAFCAHLDALPERDRGAGQRWTGWQGVRTVSWQLSACTSDPWVAECVHRFALWSCFYCRAVRVTVCRNQQPNGQEKQTSADFHTSLEQLSDTP